MSAKISYAKISKTFSIPDENRVAYESYSFANPKHIVLLNDLLIFVLCSFSFWGQTLLKKKIKYLILFFICFINALYGSEAVSSVAHTEKLAENR